MEEHKFVTKKVILVSYVKEGLPSKEHLKVIEDQINVSEANRDQNVVAVKNLWVSVDPYLRLLMKGNVGYMQSFSLNQPVVSRSIARVIVSTNPEFKVGDIVIAYSEVSEYALLSVESLQKLKPSDGVSLPDYLNVLGASGLTAWAGLLKVAEPKLGEQVFVSAAAGAVGIVVGQLAKIKGCRVVGSTSSDEKVTILQKEFGFDDAFNYKSETDWDATLTRYFPGGIDIYFENVGGPMLEAVLNHMNMNGRIPVCGMISQYNEDWHQSHGVRNLLQLVAKAVKMQGFSVRQYLGHMASFQQEMLGYLKQGKLKSKIHVKQGIESFVDGFSTMFSGGNVGKILVQLE
eukprot:TRINITY_DN3340_c0_g1_i1.p1 TRINITY_DN3340_c0_g1~~TRINITY_DN3340_c0_g1_i1.p1  ORF type:complete len:346 (-),score=50.88 TRINITY_DN3340_c0_g1_i1:267-1304(-)